MHYKTIKHATSKEWIIFLHGFGGNASIFYKQLKPLRESYNLLLLDLPGHGKSPFIEGANLFEYASEQTVKVMDQLKIKSAHFIGISLGTIIMQEVALLAPERIKSMILGGATPKLKKWGEVLVKLSMLYPVRTILPHMVPYKVFARVLLPKKNHSNSRKAFVKEAYKLSKEAYISWIHSGLKCFKTYEQLMKTKNTIPKIYISGSEDHMFLDNTVDYVANEENSIMEIIPNCGHVCNIEQSDVFNELCLNFLKKVQLNETSKAV